MKHINLLAVIFSAFSFSWAQSEFISYFAQVGDGLGLTAALVLVNSSPSLATGTVSFFRSDGGPMVLTIEGVKASKFNFSIPRSTKLLQTNGASAPSQAGWALVTSDRSLEGVALFQFSNSKSELVSEAGVSRSIPLNVS